MRALLVEDDPNTAKSIEMMLTHANLNVYCTDMGEEGIDLAKLYDYDLILLDLNLPDMTRHEVLRQLRLARITTPILILSGTDDTESKIRGFGFGADDYLTKPYHREELIARIHNPFFARARLPSIWMPKPLRWMARPFILRAKNIKCWNCCLCARGRP